MKKTKLLLLALLLASGCDVAISDSTSSISDEVSATSEHSSADVSSEDSSDVDSSIPASSEQPSDSASSSTQPSVSTPIPSTDPVEPPVLDGYYSTANNKTGYALKSALHEIINDHTVVSYDDVREWQKIIDLKPDGTIWDIYSDVPGGTPPYTFSPSKTCGNYKNEGDCWNREHSFPKSWFNDAKPMYSDIFHLYPTDGKVNGYRSNYPFGNVSNATYTSKNGSKLGTGSNYGYTGIVFEPIDEYKGDLARTYFYMATRYEDKISGWSSVMLNKSSSQAFSDWAVNLLLEWHHLDPVSQKEIDRNNAIYEKIQHNRNPFIDYPAFVDMIWKPQ